ncbi:LacI family transcriptional regulator [Flavobacterium sp. L1I52]|uniref:LacI family transcriptional regulator n=1 Tax=Flavobacterium pokkalii TaxID=1940408 RepID=A0ABR7UPS5_9FLAO|nr:LacI family DNA-binding transcriptional regulator [Flavobacterium pokkalii]KQB44309.1 Transcriptional regulator [Flavobacterium daejeonense]MBD0724416.1 LacI family transcriptional regulator [Flavobacterium pokkalii]
MEENKVVTIYDIAEKLNLATSTISRALKDHHTISEKTIKKVKKVAEEMGYVPNTLAAGLRGNKTQTIGVLVPTVTQPFLSSLISGIEITAQKSGYNVIIMQSNDSYEAEVSMAKSLYGSRVSGVICSLAMKTTDTSHFQQFVSKDIPLVFVDRVPKDFDTFKVIIDNYAAGFKATEHLIEQGCTRIGHLTAGSKFGNLYTERMRGYLDALKKHNITPKEELIVDLKAVTYEEGVKASNKLLDLKTRPDGIFASGDIMAVSAIQSAKKRGLKVPEDIAIIGFNNDPISEIIDPNLSTITHPAAKMGQISAEIILKNIKSAKKSAEKGITYLDTEVLVRESSQKN